MLERGVVSPYCGVVVDARVPTLALNLIELHLAWQPTEVGFNPSQHRFVLLCPVVDHGCSAVVVVVVVVEQIYFISLHQRNVPPVVLFGAWLGQLQYTHFQP